MRLVICALILLSVFSWDAMAQVSSPKGQDPAPVEVTVEGTPVTPVVSASDAPEPVAPVVSASDAPEPVAPVEDVEPDGFWARLWAWLVENWIAAIMGFIVAGEFLARFTPTENDNKWFAWLRDFVDRLFPSRRVGGGKFK